MRPLWRTAAGNHVLHIEPEPLGAGRSRRRVPNPYLRAVRSDLALEADLSCLGAGRGGEKENRATRARRNGMALSVVMHIGSRAGNRGERPLS